MKNIITKISIFLALVAFFGVLTPKASAAVVWNNGTQDPGTVFSKVASGTNTGWAISTNAAGATRVSVEVWYHNNGNTASNNTRIHIDQPTGSASSFSIGGGISSDNGPSQNGTTTISFSSPVTLTYVAGSLRSYLTNNGQNIPVSYTGDIFNGGINIGTVEGENTCTTLAYCHQGTVVVSFDVSQQQQTQQCIINSFDANPSSVAYGSSSNLTWSTNGCSVTLNGSQYGSSYSYPTGPLYSTQTYTITGVTAPYPTRTVTVSVQPYYQNNCSITSFSPNQTYVPYGNSATLSWTTTGCAGVTLNGSTQPANYSGYATGQIYGTQTYTLVGTSAPYPTQTVTVTTSTYYPTYNNCSITYFTASPQTVQYGGYTTLSWGTSNCNYVTVDGYTYNSANSSGNFGPLYSGRTYVLTAYGYNGNQDTRSLYVNVYNQQQYNYCTITAFNASPTQVEAGNSSTLYWNTNNCTSVQITPAVSGTYYNQLNGSGSTGPIYSTQTYTLNAYGTYGNATAQTVTVSVIPKQNLQPTLITTQATSVTQSSAYINGLALDAGNYGTSLFFEWGKTMALGNTTVGQTTASTGQVPFFERLTGLSANTTYYFRAVGRTNGQLYRGDILQFTTRGVQIIAEPPVVITQPTTVVTTPIVERGIGLGTNLVQLEFQNQFSQFGTANVTQNVCVDDTAVFTVHYKNISGITLNNAILHIDMPKDIEFMNTSSGIYNSADNTITITLGTLNPDQEGTVSLSGKVLKSAATRDLLVVTATLSIENPKNSARETAIAYGLASTQNCTRNNLAGLALFGNGFFPTTLIGWLFLLLIILALIYLARRMYMSRKTARKPTAYYEHMDVPTAPYHN